MQHARPVAEVNEPLQLRPGDNPFVRPTGGARPIHKLPFEILSRTLEFGVAVNDHYLDEMRTSYVYQCLEEAAGEERGLQLPSWYFPPFQVIVSHVCRHWRHVATSTASLWTDIRVQRNTMRPPFTLVSLHLEWSKRLPIDIIVDGYCVDTSSDVQFLYALFIPHVHRWRSFELRAGPRHMSTFLDAVSDPSIPSASQLTTLRLHHFYQDDDLDYYCDPQFWSEFPTIFNGSAPRLTHLVLLAVHVEWTSTWISAASNLTTLEFLSHLSHICPSWAEFATILRGAPALRKLTLCGSAPAEPPDEWFIEPTETNASASLNAPIQLLQLTDLVLGSLLEDVAIGLLRKFYMPALKTLILDFKEGDYSTLVAELTSPATSLTPPSAEDPPSSLASRLERLAIIRLPCDDEDEMIRLFDCLENLKVLRVALKDKLEEDEEDVPPIPLMLELLLPIALPKEVIRRLPLLESLFLCPSRWNAPHIRNVVQQRMDAGVPLKSLYVSSGEDIDEEWAWFCERLERVGYVHQTYYGASDQAFEPAWSTK